MHSYPRDVARTKNVAFLPVPLGAGNLQPGGCHSVHRNVGPCLPCVISVMSAFCVHLVIYQHQLGLPEAHSRAGPWQGRLYTKSSQKIHYVIADGTIRHRRWYSTSSQKIHYVIADGTIRHRRWYSTSSQTVRPTITLQIIATTSLLQLV